MLRKLTGQFFTALSPLLHLCIQYKYNIMKWNSLSSREERILFLEHPKEKAHLKKVYTLWHRRGRGQAQPEVSGHLFTGQYTQPPSLFPSLVPGASQWVGCCYGALPSGLDSDFNLPVSVIKAVHYTLTHSCPVVKTGAKMVTVAI